MRGNVDRSVAVSRGKSEHVVVLVDRSADGAEAVVAVRENVGHGEGFKPARARREKDSYIGYIVGSERVELQTEVLFVARRVVRGEDRICHCLTAGE